jgi:hypothetical protein
MVIRGSFKQTAEFWISDYLIDNLEKQVIWHHPQQEIILMSLNSLQVTFKNSVRTAKKATLLRYKDQVVNIL